MDDILTKYAMMTSFLGNTVGKSCEVYLLDLRQKGLPVVAKYNPHRGSMGPLRRLVKEARSIQTVVDGGVVLNRGIISDTQKLMKCSLYFIKDEDGRAAGVLCLVLRLQSFLELYTNMEGFIHVNTAELSEAQPNDAELLTREPTLELIDRMTAEFTADPQRMTPDEREELLLDLYETGVFDLKGAVSRAAAALHMSEQSIYRYLSRIRKTRE